MLDEQMKNRATVILNELELGPDQTLEKWMTHYLVELIERAENAETTEQRERAAKESANIILTLWDQKKKKLRHEYYSALNTAFENMREDKQAVVEIIKAILESHEQVNIIEDSTSRMIILFYINIYESDLLRLYLIADIATKMQNDEIAEEVLKEFEGAENIFASTKRRLEDLWPDIAPISLTNIRELQKLIREKLNAFHTVRGALLSQMELP